MVKVAEANKGQNLSRISTATAPRNYGKAASRKRPLAAREGVVHNPIDVGADDTEASFQDEVINPTTLVERRAARPADPPPSAPLVLKRIAGSIRKCSGCFKVITTSKQILGSWCHQQGTIISTLFLP